MIDEFSKYGRSLISPAENAVEIVPGDSAQMPHASRAVYVGQGGDLRVQMLGGGIVTFRDIPSGTLMPVRISRVFATGTDAAAILGLW
jgi:hypothetical protein